MLRLARLRRLDSSIRLKDAMKIYRACMLGAGTFSGLVKAELMNQGFDIFSDAVTLKKFAEAQVCLPLPRVCREHFQLLLHTSRPCVNIQIRPTIGV